MRAGGSRHLSIPAVRPSPLPLTDNKGLVTRLDSGVGPEQPGQSRQCSGGLKDETAGPPAVCVSHISHPSGMPFRARTLFMVMARMEGMYGPVRRMGHKNLQPTASCSSHPTSEFA